MGEFGLPQLAATQLLERASGPTRLTVQHGTAWVEIDFQPKLLVPRKSVFLHTGQAYRLQSGENAKVLVTQLGSVAEMANEARVLFQHLISPAFIWFDDTGLSVTLSDYTSAWWSFNPFRADTCQTQKLFDLDILLRASVQSGHSGPEALRNVLAQYPDGASTARSLLGLPLHTWYERKRVLTAKYLLAFECFSAKQTAYALGYYDPAHFNRAFSRANRGMGTQQFVATAGQPGGDPLVGRFLQLVRHNGGLSVAEYAQQLAVSPSWLAKRTSSALGRSPQEIVVNQLAAEVYELLVTGSLPVGELAHHFNFSSTAAFSTFVRRLFGHSPTALRATYNTQRDSNNT